MHTRFRYREIIENHMTDLVARARSSSNFRLDHATRRFQFQWSDTRLTDVHAEAVPGILA